jgi:hypothetical protein
MTTAPTSLLAQALDAVPGHRRLSDAIQAAEQHAATLPPPPADPAAEIANEVRAELLAGRPIPDSIGAQLVAAENEQRQRQAAATLLGVRFGGRGSGIIGQLVAERDQLVRSHADDALAHLAGELTAVLDRVTEADRILGPVRTVEQALAADAEVGSAWRVLSEAVAAYDAIRVAQAEVLVAGGVERGRVRPTLEDAGIHRDADTVDPRWQSRIEGEEPTPNDAVLAARSPWPAALATRGAGWWPTTDRASYLRWLGSGPARPWVPTRSQLARQLAKLEAAVTDAAAARRAPSGPSEERALVAAAVASRARFR